MNTVVERLIESWLDSQTEKRYQPAFVQMLISEGWTVLHNTRHSAMEFGKDVVARDPSGALFCFQLKGNPGSRLTKSEAQRHVVQFVELLEAAVPGHMRRVAKEKFTAVFVTNGEIDEEAQSLFAAVATRLELGNSPASRYELWGRGQLLRKFSVVAGSIWPTSPEGTRLLLNIMAQTGLENIAPQELAKVFVATAPRPSPKTSSPAKTSALSALLLVAEIAKAPWYSRENHYALYAISILTATYALRFADNKKRLAMVADYAETALSHAKTLLAEAKSEDFQPERTWSAGDMLAEVDIMWERRNLIAECAAVVLLSKQGDRDFDVSFAQRIIEDSVRRPQIWGQGAIPSLIVRYWAATRWARSDINISLGRTTRIILEASSERVDNVLPPAAPYYSFEDCWARKTNQRFFADDGLFGDAQRRRMWFGRSLIYILAKRNWKQTCRAIWPSYTRVLHEEADLPPSTFFDATLSKEGRVQTATFRRGDWETLLAEAIRSESDGTFLQPYRQLSWMLAGYVALVPYRAWTGVTMWLDRQLNPSTWY